MAGHLIASEADAANCDPPAALQPPWPSLEAVLQRPLSLPRWVGWRLKAMVAIVVMALAGVLLMAHWLASQPRFPFSLPVTPAGEVRLDTADYPPLRPLEGRLLKSIVIEHGGSAEGSPAIEAPIPPLALFPSGRWLLDEEGLRRFVAGHVELSNALDQWSPDGVTVRLKLQGHPDEPILIAPRGWAGITPMYWVLATLSLVVASMGAMVLLSNADWRYGGFALLSMTQAGNLLLMALESNLGLFTPTWLLSLDTALRALFDLLGAAGLVHIALLNSTPARHWGFKAAAAWTCALGLWTLHGGLPAAQAWWLLQLGCAGLAMCAIALTLSEQRRLPHPLNLLMFRVLLIGSLTRALLTLAGWLTPDRPLLRAPAPGATGVHAAGRLGHGRGLAGPAVHRGVLDGAAGFDGDLADAVDGAVPELSQVVAHATAPPRLPFDGTGLSADLPHRAADRTAARKRLPGDVQAHARPVRPAGRPDRGRRAQPGDAGAGWRADAGARAQPGVHGTDPPHGAGDQARAQGTAPVHTRRLRPGAAHRRATAARAELRPGRRAGAQRGATAHRPGPARRHRRAPADADVPGAHARDRGVHPPHHPGPQDAHTRAGGAHALPDPGRCRVEARHQPPAERGALRTGLAGQARARDRPERGAVVGADAHPARAGQQHHQPCAGAPGAGDAEPSGGHAEADRVRRRRRNGPRGRATRAGAGGGAQAGQTTGRQRALVGARAAGCVLRGRHPELRRRLPGGSGGPGLRARFRSRFPLRRVAQDLVQRGQTLGHLHDTRQAQRAQAFLGSGAAQAGHVDLRVHGAADGLGDRQQLVKADAAFEARHAALQTAHRLVGVDLAVHAPGPDGLGQGLLVEFGVGLLAVRAQGAHQPLGQHADDGGADEVAGHAQVGQAGDGRGRVVGVQGREHQVTRQRGLDRHLRRFEVADFADHDDVRVLPHEGAHALGKTQVDGRLHLRLVEGGLDHFDRVFDGADVDLVGGHALERGVQRGGLARARGAGDQNDAVRAAHQAFPDLGFRRRKAQRLEGLDGVVGIEDAHDQLLAEGGRHGRQAHFDFVAAGVARLDAAVERAALFDHVHAAQQLDVRGLGLHDGQGHLVDGVQHAVDAETDGAHLAARLEVDVGGALVEGVLPQPVDHLDDALVVGGGL